ncbi:MAG: RluA family pseudouridine synthase [Candidatus Brocadiia bacterium]
METIELQVEEPRDDLVAYLAAALPTLPLNVIRRLVARGRVEVDGQRVDHRWAPRPGQRIRVRLPDTPIVRYKPQPLDLEVLYEDSDLLAISKPVGLSVLPDPGSVEARLINGLLHYVQHHSPHPCARIHVVHRLDKETSGVLLVAKHVAAARHLSARFEKRQVGKLYVAVVRGRVEPEEGEVDLPIAQHTRGRMRIRRRRGRPAHSRYRVGERFRRYTLLEVRPTTGRQHQVRLHLSGIGHPLAVDPLYGGQEAVYLSELKRDYRPKPHRPEPPVIDRLTLHARRLEIERPDGTPLAVEAPLPKDLQRLLRTLRKYDSLP